MSLKKEGIRILVKTLILAGILAVALIFVFQIHRMTGNEMSPFVRDGDLCIFLRPGDSYLNDVVLYEDADGKKRVGRIVARGGQTVAFAEQGGYTVDGYQPTEEIPYETWPAEDGGAGDSVALAEDEYFILNDFRQLTNDSREMGAVKKSQIKGKLLFLMRRRNF